MNLYLRQAIDLAIENVNEGGTPFGAVLVRNDEVVGTGVNTGHLVKDVSGHAELIAIRKAQTLLNTDDLSDCKMYASGHPCPMCFGAIGFVGIKEVYYSNSLEEAAKVGLGLSSNIYQYLAGDLTAIPMDIIDVAIDEGLINPMTLFGKVSLDKK